MASYTPNYHLKKPTDAESYDINDANGNMDIIDGALNTLNGKITTIRPTTQLDTMSDLVSLINASASGLFVNCRIGSTIVNKLCGVSARQGTINAFKSNASSDYIEYTVIDTEAVVYSGFYKISTDTAIYNQLALNSRFDDYITSEYKDNSSNLPTIAANSQAYADVDVTKSGYTAMGILGITGSTTNGLTIQEFFLSSLANARVYLRNNTSSSITPTKISLLVLYKKN